MDILIWILVLVGLFGGFTVAENTLKRAMMVYYKVKREEHRTRQIEALTKLPEPDRQRLLATMPDWLDKDDPEDVEAWKQARVEVNKTGRKK